MGKGLSKKDGKFLSLTFACCGLLLIGSGIGIGTIKPKTITKKIYSIEIAEKKVEQSQTNDLELNDMELEINNPLSLNVKDYIKNIEEISPSVLKALKLDTSMVNINQAGTYTYTVSYKKKKYNGTYVIKEKELPKVELTLKNLNLEKGAALSTNISTYIVEEISDEVKNNITLNLRDVNTAQPGSYKYSVIYNNTQYDGTIWIYEKQPTVITPNTEVEEKVDEENE